MGSNVPGAVTTDPPTAKLPCSWIISGSGLFLLVSCALAEVKREAATNESAMKDFQCFLLMGFAPITLGTRVQGCSFQFPAFAYDFSYESSFVAHFFSKASLATLMAFTALGQPA